MSNRSILFVVLFSLGLILFISFAGGESKTRKKSSINPAFSGYISAFTSGTISAGSDIRIILAKEHSAANIGEPVSEELFDFEPSIKGKAVWTDSRTITFHPESSLPHDAAYKASFKLHKLVDVQKDLKTLEFEFRTMRQDLVVETQELTLDPQGQSATYQLAGIVYTADVAHSELVEKAVSVSQENSNLPVRWVHESDQRTHRFVVDSIRRRDVTGSIRISWEGELLQTDEEDSFELLVPASGVFTLIGSRVVQSPEQYVVLNFSDIPADAQNLDGLISIGDIDELRFTTNANNIQVFLPERISGLKSLTIQKELKDASGRELTADVSSSLLFEEIKPAVRLKGEGVIVPGSQGMLFPFEAVNLRAVDVKIYRIFEDNIPQFLQINQLSGSSELRRVGRKVLQKIVPLNGTSSELNTWKRYNLDLSTLISPEPGAIYRVVIDFQRNYSTFRCEGDEAVSETFVLKDNWTEENEDDAGYYWYDGEDDYYYYEDEEYDWEQRDNPCHSMYYRQNRSISRNILTSDLGIIAKQGTDGSLLIGITDLNTTEPISGVQLQVLNYQQRILKTASTGADGIAEMVLDTKPFLLIASHGNQKGYLRLDDASSLSLSAFEVGGEKVQEGIKGFIYTERGVWRPGDSIHATFILEDSENKLPPSHPVLFELINPLGQKVHSTIQSSGLQGFYYQPFKTEEQDITGNYNLRVKVGGAVFNKSLKVETIVPNRLKLNLDFGREKLTSNDAAGGTLSAHWLHGAVARNLKAKVDVALSRSGTSFPDYEDFVFDDEARPFPAEEKEMFQGSLNEEGNVVVPLQIKTGTEAPGVLNANFTVRVFEEGGSFSIDRFSLPYYPYEVFAGIKIPGTEEKDPTLTTDTEYDFKIVTLNAEGQRQGNRTLTAEIYKLDWRWWWDRRNEDAADYLSSYYQRNKETTTLQTDSQGEASWDLKVPSGEWGRYLLRVIDEGGHATSTIVYFDWPAWDRKNRDTPGAASMLMFSSDKEEYQTGEFIRVSIPTPDAGTAFVTVENGKGVLIRQWIQTSKGETTYSFKAEHGMAPNVFVSVTLLQPYAQTANSLPIRMYGVLPISISDPGTLLSPEIEMPETLIPEQTAELTVSEKNGRAMSYTLALVDEGLLDLTRFKTPDPWSAFYAREALGVRTWDMYDHVLGAETAGLQRILAIGGDGQGALAGTPKANRFKPMVLFLGPFNLDEDESNHHKITIPRYVGSVRVMVIAGRDRAYGKTEKTVPVKKPLMLLATLPRILSIGDQVQFPVNVFAMEKDIRSVQVTLGKLKNFSNNGAREHQLQFETTGDKLARFNLTSASTTSVGKVSVTATSGKHKATEEIEIAIRNPNQAEYRVEDAIVRSGETISIPIEPFGMEGSEKVWLELSSLPAMNLQQRLNYLISYPHGCLEQVVSTAFAQLHLGNLLTLSTQEKERTEKYITEGLAALRKYQLPNGSFSYWAGQHTESDWGTSYAGHFMVEAERLGYKLPAGMLESWKRFQKQKAASWIKEVTNRYGASFRNADLMQAYRLYTLALAGSPEMGSMNRMREQRNLSVQATWRLAAAYYLAGQEAVAKSLTGSVSPQIEDYREFSYTYGSQLRDRAMILETMTLAGDIKQAAVLLKEVAGSLASSSWLSTQETAFALYAIMKTVPGMKPGPLNATYTINGKTTEVRSQESFRKIALPANSTTLCAIENNSSGILFARVITEGIPLPEVLPSIENNLRMKVQFLDMNGKSIDPSSLNQGTDLIAEVTVTHPGTRQAYKEMALTIPFCSGWEIINQRMSGIEFSGATDQPEYQDIRDDRVLMYFDLDPGKSKTFRVKVNAAYLGNFYAPPISCEAMYDHSVYSRKGGEKVTVHDGTPASKEINF